MSKSERIDFLLRAHSQVTAISLKERIEAELVSELLGSNARPSLTSGGTVDLGEPVTIVFGAARSQRKMSEHGIA